VPCHLSSCLTTSLLTVVTAENDTAPEAIEDPHVRMWGRPESRKYELSEEE